jgi:hypothetical protein
LAGPYQGDRAYVHLDISQLRRTLAATDLDGTLRDLIVTEPVVGYRIRDREASRP